MSETKYSFIYAIRNRANLLQRGLQSLEALNYDKENFEVIIADYMSEDNIVDVIQKFRGKLQMKYLCVDIRRYKYHKIFLANGFCNPALAQNIAIANAEGKHIILTSPEILHWTENLNNLDKIEDLENKFIYGHVIEKTEEEFFNVVTPFQKIPEMKSDQVLCDWELKEKSITLYFIGVLPRATFIKYGGIDEAYMKNIAYEDEDFGNRMKNVPGLSLEFHREIKGVHLWHDRSYQGVENILVNKEYMESKQKQGWDKNLIANQNIQAGDPDVLIQKSDFYRY